MSLDKFASQPLVDPSLPLGLHAASTRLSIKGPRNGRVGPRTLSCRRFSKLAVVDWLSSSEVGLVCWHRAWQDAETWLWPPRHIVGRGHCSCPSLLNSAGGVGGRWAVLWSFERRYVALQVVGTGARRDIEQLRQASRGSKHDHQHGKGWDMPRTSVVESSATTQGSWCFAAAH